MRHMPAFGAIGARRRALPFSSCPTRTLASSHARRNRAVHIANAKLPFTAASKARSRDAAELLKRLTTQGGTRQEISQLVDRISAAGGPFQEKLLGGGPWVAVFTKGAPLLWNATYQPARILRPTNRAAQDLDPGSRTVVNSAEYFGGQVYVTASGAYTPRDASKSTPKLVDVQISSGKLHLFGLDVPLPIRGTGQFEVCYLDSNIRIFRSGSSYSVQIRQAYLDALQ